MALVYYCRMEDGEGVEQPRSPAPLHPLIKRGERGAYRLAVCASSRGADGTLDLVRVRVRVGVRVGVRGRGRLRLRLRVGVRVRGRASACIAACTSSCVTPSPQP